MSIIYGLSIRLKTANWRIKLLRQKYCLFMMWDMQEVKAWNLLEHWLIFMGFYDACHPFFLPFHSTFTVLVRCCKCKQTKPFSPTQFMPFSPKWMFISSDINALFHYLDTHKSIIKYTPLYVCTSTNGCDGTGREGNFINYWFCDTQNVSINNEIIISVRPR